MDVARLKSVLCASGYEVRFRRDEWVDCLLVREDETWTGRGTSDAAAFEAAVRLAFPSHLALELLINAAGSVSVVEAVSVTTGATPRAPRPAVGHKVAPRPSAPPLVKKQPIPKSDLARSIEELGVLNERVRDSRDELGLCTPDRQRLAILAWICEARAHTEAFPNETQIRDDVASISRQLTEIGKAFWPGSVTALQLQMQPRELPKHLLGGFASTWTRAAELAERALHSLEHADERRGHDEHGWADLEFTQPPPSDPEAVLLELFEDVERHGGSIERYAEARDAASKPNPDRYRRWVRLLRWLRGTHVDPERWGRVCGRLRWWAGRRDPNITPLARELDSVFVPPRPWAELLERPGALTSTNGPPSSLLDDARTRCAGKRIAVVSHRRDPDLFGRLGEVLEGADLAWTVAEPGRLEILGQQIEDQSFDAVLGALGLQAPAPDRFLAMRCRLSETPYLRVNRGRPVACLRAITRSL